MNRKWLIIRCQDVLNLASTDPDIIPAKDLPPGLEAAEYLLDCVTAEMLDILKEVQRGPILEKD